MTICTGLSIQISLYVFDANLTNYFVPGDAGTMCHAVPNFGAQTPISVFFGSEESTETSCAEEIHMQ